MFIEGEESRSNRAKTASVRIPAKDRRKPVMAILHDHLEVPSIVTCSDCSRLSICVSGSTLKVRLATTCKKDYHLVCVYVCVFVCALKFPLLSPPVGDLHMVLVGHRTCDGDLGTPFRCSVENRLLDCPHVCDMALHLHAEHASVTYISASAFIF